MTTSGLHSATADLSRGKSRISPQMDRTTPATPACSNKLGWVGGSRAYPVTLAPSASNQRESQLPLKPVCPVRKTLRPCQNERLSMASPFPTCCEPAVGKVGFDGACFLHDAVSHTGQHNIYRMAPAGARCIDGGCDTRSACGHRAFCSAQSSSTSRSRIGSSTSSRDSTASFETSLRNTQPSESPIGRPAESRTVAVLSISPYVQNPPTPSRLSPAFR